MTSYCFLNRSTNDNDYYGLTIEIIPKAASQLNCSINDYFKYYVVLFKASGLPNNEFGALNENINLEVHDLANPVRDQPWNMVRGAETHPTTWIS